MNYHLHFKEMEMVSVGADIVLTQKPVHTASIPLTGIRLFKSG